MTMHTPIHKWLLAAALAPALLQSDSEAVLVIAGVTDGELSGGNPKAIILQAAAPVADLSVWGIGTANNGGGTDGQEFALPAGSAAAGDVFVIVANNDSEAFFANNFVRNFTLLNAGFAAAVNGDDAIELFNAGAVFDTYGDPNTIGDGESWDYTDGFAARIGGGPGAFDQANYQSVFRGFFDNQSEAQHVATFVSFGFTQIPEPTTSVLALLGFGLLLRRRR